MSTEAPNELNSRYVNLPRGVLNDYFNGVFYEPTKHELESVTKTLKKYPFTNVRPITRLVEIYENLSKKPSLRKIITQTLGYLIWTDSEVTSEGRENQGLWRKILSFTADADIEQLEIELQNTDKNKTRTGNSLKLRIEQLNAFKKALNEKEKSF